MQAEIPTGVAAQRVLKTLATFYKMLESATKLVRCVFTRVVCARSSHSGWRAGQVISVRPKFVTPKFQRLVAFVSRNLTKPTYTFLSLLQVHPARVYADEVANSWPTNCSMCCRASPTWG